MARFHPARLAALVFVVLTAIGLAGCTATTLENTAIFPPFPVRTPGDFQAQDVAVTVDSSKVAHYLLEESSAQGNRLVYVNFGSSAGLRQLVIAPTGDYSSYENPDIAVSAATGQVFLAWQARKKADNTYVNCWAAVQANTTTAPACTLLGARSGKSNEHPVVAAWGANVYAVFSITTGTGERSLQVANLAADPVAPQELYSAPSGTTFMEPAAEASTNGTLHVIAGLISNGYQAHYLRYTTDGQVHAMTNFTPPAGHKLQGYDVSISRVGYNSDGVYFVFNSNPDPLGHSVLDYFEWFEGSSSEDVHLVSAEDWFIPGTPDLLATPSGVVGFFSGKQTGVDNLEIWRMTNPSGSLSFSQETTTEVNETNPVGAIAMRATTASSGAGPARYDYVYTPVVIFRQAPASGKYVDLFVWDQAIATQLLQVRQAFDGSDTNTNPSYAIAAKGDQAYAGWIDQASSQDTRKVLWISFNRDYTQTFIPAVSR